MARLCFKKWRTFWRNGSTLIHTMHHLLLEVSQELFANYEYDFDMLLQDLNSNEICRRQFLTVSRPGYHSYQFLLTAHSSTSYGIVEMESWMAGS
jgi:hypothetical protein